MTRTPGGELLRPLAVAAIGGLLAAVPVAFYPAGCSILDFSRPDLRLSPVWRLIVSDLLHGLRR
ncbi:MAG: hypothetical protein MZV65_45960 [Chromatiales bacterium]|nr:hypothetical protein [Chromatiales bacterium]